VLNKVSIINASVIATSIGSDIEKQVCGASFALVYSGACTYTARFVFLTKCGNTVWSACTGTILLSGKLQLPADAGSRSGHPACVGIN
jgi:hypothetical protein